MAILEGSRMENKEQIKVTKKYQIDKVDEKLAEVPILFIKGNDVDNEQDKLVCQYEKAAGIVYITQCGEKVIGLHKRAKYCTYCGRWIRINERRQNGT